MAETQAELLKTHKVALKALEDRHAARAKSVSYHLASRVVKAKANAQHESVFQQAAFKELASASSKNAAVLRSAHRAGAVTGRHHAKKELEALGLKSPVVPIADSSPYTVAARTALSDSVDETLGKLYDAPTADAARGHVKELVRRAAVAASVVANRAYTDQQIAMWNATAAANPDKIFEKVWATNPLSDPCERCLALDGSVVGLADEFPYDATDPVFQNDLNGPPRHPNCRCRLVLRVRDASGPDPAEAALAAFAATHLDGDELLELHGHKGQPGYFLLHDPDKKKADAATAIYKIYGQHAVTPSSVANVLEGKSVTGAVPAGTLPAHVTLPNGTKYRLNPGEHAVSNEHYTVGGPTGIAIVKPNGDIVHHPGHNQGGSEGNVFSPGSSGHKAVTNAWKNKIAEHKPVGSGGAEEGGIPTVSAVTLPYGGTYDMKPGDKQLGKSVESSNAAVVIQHANGDLTFWTGNNADAVTINEKEDKTFHDKVTGLWNKTVAVAPSAPGEKPAPSAPSAPNAPSIELPNGENYELLPGDKQLTQHTDGTFDKDAVVVQHADGSISTWVDMGDGTEHEVIPTSDLGHPQMVGYYNHVIAEGPKAAEPAPAGNLTGLTTEIPKQGGGSIAVSPDELASAIHTLKNQAGIYVKQPLQKIDHPLQHMDYHAVAALHPEVKAKAGKDKTKQAVLHHLETQLAHATAPPPPPAPTTTSFGGVDNLTVEHLKSAHATLSDAKGIMVKQPLSAAQHPLAAMDYHAVAKDHADATGNKLVGKDKTKQNVLGALDAKIKEMEGHGPSTAAPSAAPAGAVESPTPPKQAPNFHYKEKAGSFEYHFDATSGKWKSANGSVLNETVLNDPEIFQKVPNDSIAPTATEAPKSTSKIPVGAIYHMSDPNGETSGIWNKTGDGTWHITYDDGANPQDVSDFNDQYILDNSSFSPIDVPDHFNSDGKEFTPGEKFTGDNFSFAGDGPYTILGISGVGGSKMVHFKNAAGETKSANEFYFKQHSVPLVSDAAKDAGDTSYYIEAPTGAQYHKNADGTWQYIDKNGVLAGPSQHLASSFEQNALDQGWKKVEKGNAGDPAHEAAAENEPAHLFNPATGRKYYQNADGTWKVVGPDGLLVNPAAKKTLAFHQKALDAGWKWVGETEPSKPVEPEAPAEAAAPKAKKTKSNKGAIAPADLIDKYPLPPPTSSYTASAISAQYKQYVEQLGLKNHSITPGFMDKAEKQMWAQHIYKGNFAAAYQLELSEWQYHKHPGQDHPHKLTHPGSPDNPLNHGVPPAPLVTPAAVHGEVPAGVPIPGNWPESIYDWDPDQIDAYLLAAGMKNSAGLHQSQKKSWVNYHKGGYKSETDQLSVQAQTNFQNGNYYTEEITPPKPVIPVGQVVPQNSEWKPFNKELNHAINLDELQTNDYLSNLLTPKALAKAKKQDLKVRQAIVQQHWLAGNLAAGDEKEKAQTNAEAVLKELEASATGGYDPNLPVFGEKHSFTLKPNQPNLPGYSKKSIVLDEHGKEWLFKYDKEGGWRSEVENTAHNAGNFFGFGTAPAQVGKFNGSAGLFQAMLPNDGDVSGTSPHTLTLTQQKDVAAEHLLDWALDNDDAHNQNFLILPNGHAFGIDKGRAWKHLGTSGKSHTLDWPSSMSYNAHLYYEDLYNDIAAGKISQEDTDAIYRHVMARANAMSRKSDDRYREILNEGLKNRPGYNATLVNNIVGRKNALPEDFDKLWSKVYEKAGWEKPDLAKGRLENHFVGTSPELIDAVKTNQVHGKSTFFGGKDLDDGHMLVYETQGTVGKPPTLHATGHLREDANAALMEWIKNHGGGELHTHSSSYTPTPTKSGAQKQAEEWHNIVLGAAKTVSHHQMDKEYNQSKLAEMEKLKQLLGDESSHDHVPSDLKQWEFDQYDNMVAFYKNAIDNVEKLKEEGGKSKAGDYVPFDWQDLENPLGSEPEAPALKIEHKIEYGSGEVPSGVVNDNGELVASSKMSNGQSYEYKITLPSGAVIRYVSWDHGVKAQQGRFTIEAEDYGGTSDKLDNALDVLREAGVSLDPASEDDMELLYWRQLHGVMANRKGTTDSDAVKAGKALLKQPNLDSSNELAEWHKIMGEHFGDSTVSAWVDGRGYLPKYKHMRIQAPDEENGRPYWDRLDVSDKQALSKKMLMHGLGGGDSAAASITKVGALLPTEERTRMLGDWITGMSSGSDQSHGSSGFLFTRQNQDDSGTVLINPKVAKRLSNYSYASDHYGEIDSRASGAPFDFNAATGFTGGNNEMMIKYGVSLLDDIEVMRFDSASHRQQAIDTLAKHGITEIRGVPVGDRLVTYDGWHTAVKAARERIAEEAKTA